MGVAINLTFEVRENTASPWEVVEWNGFVPRGDSFLLFGVCSKNPEERGFFGGRGWPADASEQPAGFLDNLSWVSWVELRSSFLARPEWQEALIKAAELMGSKGPFNVRLLVGFSH